MPFKKIFKPIAKVLDKIIPNEIKPALPYLAAFAPVFGPPGVQGLIGSTMGRRALTSGLLNIGAQLSQEGSEGDINLLSAGLGALQGAMTTPGAAETFAGMQTFGGRTLADIGEGTIAGKATGLEKLKNFGLESLAKGSNILRPEGAIPDLLSKAGAKAAVLPAATATGDVMQAQARQLEKQAAIDAALAEAETFADSGARAAAIRNAMNAYGFFTDEEIEETIASAGYRAGGRVGFEMGGLGRLMQGRRGEETEENFLTIDGGEGIKLFMLDDIDKPIIRKSYSKEDSGRRNEAFFEIINPETGAISTISQEDYFKQYGEPRAKGGRVGFRFGGIDAAIDKVEDESIKESMKFASDIGDMDIPIVDLVEEFEIIFKRKPSSLDELKQFYRDFYEYKGPGENIKMKEKIKETVTVEAKDGGLMDLGGKEMDLRGGGFVPIGKKERADDVPARLSKNEFVMTADAVRGAGGGDINKGAKRMYETMNNLEARA